MAPLSKQNSQGFSVLIVAAGRGSRFGTQQPKQYHMLAGQPVLAHTIEAFTSHPCLKELCVVIHPDDEKLFKNCVKTQNNIIFCHGGKTRKESVSTGLEIFSNASNEDIVLIHDAVRPCVNRNEIDAVLEALDDYQAASLYLPISSTVAQTSASKDKRKAIRDYLDRDSLAALQTPQGFRFGTLKSAHAQFGDTENNADITDDTALMKAAGIEVCLVPGSGCNIKITYEDDLKMAAAIMNQGQIVRTGSGFDVHALIADKKRPLMLCGVHINSDMALKGHSDADVGLHAITDALLGACGLGDIGDHFPPNEPVYKDADSAGLLGEALLMARSKGYEVVNADVTLICEVPKISGYKAAMKNRLTEILQCNDDAVNIKATTTEGLGFAGRGEGIAAMASVSVRGPA